MGIYPPNAVLNAIVLLPTGVQLSRGVDPHEDVLTCATEIRKSLEKLRDPRLIEDMAADFARMKSHSAWNRGSELLSEEGHLIMNVTRR